MVRAPRETLTAVVARPRSLDLALLIMMVSSVCSAGFLMTQVGRLAALDQQVRQLESFGVVVDDTRYANLRTWVPYRPAIAAAAVAIGWPLFWVASASIVKGTAERLKSARHTRTPTFAQVLTVIVHASAVFAPRSVIAAAVNYSRESLGGATSLRTVMPGFADSTFPGRLLGAVDIFVLWWVVLVAIGLGILYETRALPIARWLFGAYVAGAVLLAVTQALRGGI